MEKHVTNWKLNKYNWIASHISKDILNSNRGYLGNFWKPRVYKEKSQIRQRNYEDKALKQRESFWESTETV